MKVQVNAIYATYQGEQNISGIGAPVIFLRLQGCHLRCYLKTLGVLCDTPEALSRKGGKEMLIEEILGEVHRVSLETGGIKLVCLSGGDPLWGKQEIIHNLLTQLTYAGYTVSVETSGTLSIEPYREIPNVSWVVDYKSKSAGIKEPFLLSNLGFLTKNDYIKFVLFSLEDYYEFLDIMGSFPTHEARITVGCYWGGSLTYSTLIDSLKQEALLGKVLINMQAHKLLTLLDTTDISLVSIPKEI